MGAAFRYLKVALAFVLALVGVKMLAQSWLKSLLGPDCNLYLLGRRARDPRRRRRRIVAAPAPRDIVTARRDERPRRV